MSFGRRNPQVNSDGPVGTSRVYNGFPMDDIYELNDQLGLGLFEEISGLFDDIPVPNVAFVDFFAWDINAFQMYETPADKLDTNSDSDGDAVSHYRVARGAYSNKEDYAHNFVPSKRIYATLGLKTPAPSESDSGPKTTLPEPAQRTNNTSQHGTPDSPSDPDSQDGSIEYRLHYCRHRPCILGCQDKNSKMLWRDATTFTPNQRHKKDTEAMSWPSVDILRS